MDRRNMTAAAVVAGALVGFASAAAAEELLIGEIHPITGPAAFYGVPMSNGVQLAADEINKAGGVKVGGKVYTLRVENGDDQANPTAGVAALRKLTTQGTRFIIGPLVSGIAPALKPIIERNPDMTQIIDGAAAEGLINGKNSFRVQADSDHYNDGLQDIFKEKKYKTFATLTDRFHVGFMGSHKLVVDNLIALGATPIDQDTFKLGDTDFSAQLTKIVAKNPDAIVIRGYPSEGALITKQAQQLGYKGQIIWGMMSPPQQTAAIIPSAAMEGVYNATPSTAQDLVKQGGPAAERFDKAYRAKFNTGPGEQAALSYDAVWILKAAMERGGDVSNPVVNKAMKELKVSDVPDAVNHYIPYENGLLFDDIGQAHIPSVAQVWRNGDWVPLK